MGLLDSVIGALGQSQGGASPQAELLQALVRMLAQGSQGGASGAGGLADLVARFQQGGLGDVIGSWVGSGQNLPVSAEQLGAVLGDDWLSGLSRQSGQPAGDLLGQLSQMLPHVVDHLTPEGRVPEGGLGDVGAVLGQLLGR